VRVKHQRGDRNKRDEANEAARAERRDKGTARHNEQQQQQ
jgi:hypothetical protein